jgi:peptidoglycan/LPS O-acetylase OafA/YrhL
LFHQPILNAAPNLMTQPNTEDNISQLLRLATCIFSWFPIILIAWLSYLYLELPSVKTGKLFLRPRLG